VAVLRRLPEPAEIGLIRAKSANREPLLRGTRLGHFCCGTEHEAGFNHSSFGRRICGHGLIWQWTPTPSLGTAIAASPPS
jgi:hypothetical protein